jgi:uncharacterized protein YjbI with pentapeptide repeats
MSDFADPPPDPERTALHIARINELTSVGRANWLGLLAYLAFAAITLLGVEDADFFIATRQTTLPLIGVAIPTFSFFIFAPILGAALYVYLHLHIRKLAEALAAPPASVDSAPLETHLKSWLLTDLILRRRRDGATTPRRLDLLADATTLLLVWLAGPYVFFHFWWRSWPAHAEWLSTGLLISALVAVYAGINSWLSMTDALRGRRGRFGEKATALGLCVTFLPLALFTWVKTEIGTVRNFGPSAEEGADQIHFWTSLAPIELTGLVASTLPPDQLDYLSARRQFRMTWCEREGFAMDVCGFYVDWIGNTPSAVRIARASWCDANVADVFINCDRHFGYIDWGFQRDWRNYRSAQIAALSPPDLSSDHTGWFGRRFDLRNANVEGALLIGADFTGSRLDGANLREAQLQGVKLHNSQVNYVNLEAAHLAHANLMWVQMQGAMLSFADMQAAILDGAQLQHAVMFDAQLRSAFLNSAQMQGALLDGAILQGAEFVNAQMQEADLSNTQMQGALLDGSNLKGAYLRAAQLQGGSLRGTEFQGANLFEAQFLGADLSYVKISHDTNLELASLRGAFAGFIDDGTLTRLRPHWDEMLVVLETLPEDAPVHWQEIARTDFDPDAFTENWRAWAATLDPPVTIAPDWPR